MSNQRGSVIKFSDSSKETTIINREFRKRDGKRKDERVSHTLVEGVSELLDVRSVSRKAVHPN